MMEVVVANLEEDYERCVELSETSPFTKQFEYSSKRWKLKKGQLLVAKDDDGVIWGFQHLNVCERRPWTSMYYTCVAPERQGQGIGGMIFAKVIELSVAAGKEEIHFRVEKHNEQTIKFYAGFGLHPTYEAQKSGDYVYHVSFRRGCKSLEDLLAVRTTKAKLYNSATLLHELRANREKGVYSMFGRPDLSEKFKSEGDYLVRAFASFWGTNMSGKSTIPKRLVQASKFIEAYDPYFTLLDDGVVLVGLYPPTIRAGGIDRLISSGNSFVYGMRLMRELWQMEDVRVLIGEGMLAQARIGLIKRYMQNYEVYARRMVIFNCQCAIEVIEERLFQSRGKTLADYKGGGVHIRRLIADVPEVLNRANPELITVIDCDTQFQDIASREFQFREEMGL